MNNEIRSEAGQRIIQYLIDAVKAAVEDFNRSTTDEAYYLELFKNHISILEDHKYAYDLGDDGEIQCFPSKPAGTLPTTPILREEQQHPRRK